MNHNTPWICIHKTQSRFEAEALRGNLIHAGFNCVLINKQDSAYISIGYFEIHVPENEVDAVQDFLNNPSETTQHDGL